jgi:type IV pilus assembly protein PilM
MADNYFCLDIGESHIKLADIRKNGSQYEAVKIGHVETNPVYFSNNTENVIEEQASAIAKLVDGLKITKKNAGIVVPDTYTYSQILEMPKLNEKELISAIKYQADQFVPMPIAEASIDIETIYENTQSKRILVLMVASSKKFVEKIQKTVELAGLIPESVENELSATARFISDIHRGAANPQTEGIIVVNVGLSSTSLYFFEPRMLVVMMSHNFNIGLNLFIKEIQVNLNIDRAKSIEALRTYGSQANASVPLESIIAPVSKEFSFEIKKFINSINQKYQLGVKNIFLMNGVCLFPHLSSMIQSSFSVPTSLLDPYPFFVKSTTVDALKNNLTLYVSTIGGNLR